SNFLTQLATHFLSSARTVIQIISELPDSTVSVGKYVELGDTLEDPQSNLHWIRLTQLPLSEQLLNEISQNPLQLFQRQQENPPGLRTTLSRDPTNPGLQLRRKSRVRSRLVRLLEPVVIRPGVPKRPSWSEAAAATTKQRQQSSRFRQSPAKTAGAGGLSEAHGEAWADQVHGTVQGSRPRRNMIYGFTGVNGSKSAGSSHTIGIGCLDVSLPGLLCHPGPENRVVPSTTATGFYLGARKTMSTTPPLVIEHTNGDKTERAVCGKRAQTTDYGYQDNYADGLAMSDLCMPETVNGVDSDPKTSES
ncbi:hypothetical protein FGIG_10928, partial [Fasciola gigantica]